MYVADTSVLVDSCVGIFIFTLLVFWDCLSPCYLYITSLSFYFWTHNLPFTSCSPPICHQTHGRELHATECPFYVIRQVVHTDAITTLGSVATILMFFMSQEHKLMCTSILKPTHFVVVILNAVKRKWGFIYNRKERRGRRAHTKQHRHHCSVLGVQHQDAQQR